MNKTTKGALAAGAASVLLLGGAGSLAYWTAQGTVTGGTISSGELKLSAPTCDGWTLDGGAVYTAGTTKVVPGDSITNTCTYTITASGAHLSADLAVTGGTTGTGNALATALSPVASYKVGTAASQAKITSADNNKVLTSTVTVTLPYGSAGDNATQNLSATLSDFVVTATQKHA